MAFGRPISNINIDQFRVMIQRYSPADNQFSLVGGTFTSNSPSNGSVAWSQVIVERDRNRYRIEDANTSDKWIYWDKASPGVFANSANMPAITENITIVGTNEGGAWNPAWRVGQSVQAERILAGEVIGLTITSGTFRTSESNPRIEISANDGFRAINASNVTMAKIPANASAMYTAVLKAPAGYVGTQIIGGTEDANSSMSLLLQTADGTEAGNKCSIFLNHGLAITLNVNNTATFGVGSTGATLYIGDLSFNTNGKGVVLKSANGSVTKRVRLNDAGDGLIFEAP